jgi:predicted AAA+ superfamily ATPase
LADYVTTFVKRDVRQIINVVDMLSFSSFLKLCAGRTAQEINLFSLGSDAGISNNTARAWLSILETSYIIHRLPAWHTNIRKQVVKAAKLHFFDTGLACYLLGIHEPAQLRHHPLRGPIFESWVVSELYKSLVHHGERTTMFHYRESRGPEIDLLIDRGEYLHVIEIKSGATASSDFFKNFQYLPGRLKHTSLPSVVKNHVIYGGEISQQRSKAKLVPWRDALGIL